VTERLDGSSYTEAPAIGCESGHVFRRVSKNEN